MKKHKIIILLTLLISSNISVFAQSVVAQRQLVNEKTIPKNVLNTFKRQYPNVFLKGWYTTNITYWQNDISSDWYHGWYGQRTVVIYPYQKPNYYEVEFINNLGELSRAIYNIHGYWYETRSQVNGLTMGIHDALESSKYKDWKISILKEKLESPMWPVEIYRFQVSKGIKSRILRMDADGNIIQVKNINE